MSENLSRCEHPKMFYSKKNKKEIYVSCGKCLACRKARQARWVVKLQKESKCHVYTQVILLEYDDAHIPYFDYCDYDPNFLIDKTPRLSRYYSHFPDLKTFDLRSIDTKDYAEYNYVLDRLNGVKSRLAHCSVYDIQAFKKRLNTKIKREITSTYGSVRSAIVAEYGSTTFRPHYHGILFFDDERILKELPRLVSECWVDYDGSSLGYAKVEADGGHFAGYISKYITKPADIPKIYESPQFKPFFLTSRHPPIGSLCSGLENKYIFDNCTPKTLEFVREGDQIVPKVFPIGKDLENRIFPKCPLYSKTTGFDRVELYRLALDSDGVPYESFDVFIHTLLEECIYKTERTNLPSDFLDEVSWINYLRGQGLLVFRNSMKAKLVDALFDDFSTLNSFHVLYSVTLRIWHQARIFRTTYMDYVTHIFEYYDYKKPQFQLRDFYRQQSDYLAADPDLDWRYFYPLTFYRAGFKPEDHPYSIAYHDNLKFEYHEHTKTHRKNDYAESRRLKVYDYQLYLTIKNYYHAKECYEAFEAIA